MESIEYTIYVIFSLVVMAWCVLHSAMISIAVTEYLKKRLGPIFRFYRLFFNLIAILTLIPVALFAYSLQTQVIFHWNGYMRIGQVIILGIAVLLFLLGGRKYDVRQMLGIKQIKEGTSNKALTVLNNTWLYSSQILLVSMTVMLLTYHQDSFHYKTAYLR